MWTTYFLAMACALAALYVPGYLFIRALRFDRIISLACAPLYGVFAYSALPIAYYGAGIACDALTVMAPAAAVALAAFFVSRHFAKSGKPLLALPEYEPVPIGGRALDFRILALAASIAIAALVTAVVFVGNLPTPEAFYSRYDNQTHLNVVQAFLDSGAWSMLHTSSFAASPDYAMSAVASGGSFYPAAWHDVVALICCLAGAKVTVASNALITVLCAVTFPAGMLVLLCSLFPGRRAVVAAGTLVMSCFATWPWVFIIKGPCLPNLLAIALMVGALGVVVRFVESRQVRAKPASFIAFSLMALAVLAFSHPNTVFTAFVFLAAYGAHVIYRAIGDAARIPDSRRTAARIGALALYLAAIVAFWLLCYQLPYLHSVLSYRWSEHSSLLYSLASLGSLSMVIAGVQAAMMVACLIGVVRCIRERSFWLLVPVLFFSLAFLASKTGIDPLKYYVASLWYQTPYRFTACISVFLMPIAALGVESVARWADNLVARRSGRHASTRSAGHIGAVVAIAVFLVVTFLPAITLPVDGGKTVRPGFALTEYRIDEIYRADKEHVYSTEEVAFVDKALGQIPEGALVLNQPNDGSVFAYGVNHLNTYFRHGRAGKKNDTAKVIQKHLAEYATDEEAREAVETTGARYLLQLDQGVAYEDGVWLNQYKEKNVDSWSGIDAVRDDTPGFTVVLAEGDMRLYRLDAIE